MFEIPFFKKFSPGLFSLKFLAAKPSRIMGIDIGTYSTKVIQLRYEKERGILETYGELLNEGYFPPTTNPSASFLHHSDTEVAALLKDLLRESNATDKEVVFGIPANSSFITTITFPQVAEKELKEAIPFEARRYVPIPVSEVALDWEVLGTNEARDRIEVLLIAVPTEIIEKFKRVSQALGLTLQALEVESFSIIRALSAGDQTPTTYINIGHQTTTLAIADRGRLRVSHNFSRGSNEITKLLERGLGISAERAEALKRDVGLSEKLEEKEIASVISPFVETMFSEIERFISIYNRKAPRTVQKINLCGGGSNLRGLVEYTVSRLGIEVTRGNPFARVATPAFMQPILREIGPGFAQAVGLALHEITAG